MNALVAVNGSYIVRPCGHDLHGPTLAYREKLQYHAIRIVGKCVVFLLPST